MQSVDLLAQIFSGLGNKRRLQILDCIESGTSNPNEIALKMDLPRSTVEKHIRVLRKAGLLEKMPGLSPKGQLRLYYRITEVAENLLEAVKAIVLPTNE